MVQRAFDIFDIVYQSCPVITTARDPGLETDGAAVHVLDPRETGAVRAEVKVVALRVAIDAHRDALRINVVVALRIKRPPVQRTGLFTRAWEGAIGLVTHKPRVLSDKCCAGVSMDCASNATRGKMAFS